MSLRTLCHGCVLDFVGYRLGDKGKLKGDRLVGWRQIAIALLHSSSAVSLENYTFLTS